MAIKKVFCSVLKSCSYIFKDGRFAYFVGGEYHTDNEKDIEELEAEIKANHPHIFINPARTEVDTDSVDPIEFIKQKAISDYIAQQKAREGADFGTTEDSGSNKIKGIQTTAGIKVGAVESLSSKK